MKKSIRKLIKFISIYLIASSMYIQASIDDKIPIFYEANEPSKLYNIIRILMGLPKAYNQYQPVSPRYMKHVVVKLIIGISLIICLIIDYLKNKKESERKSFKIVVKKIIGYIFLIFIYIIYLYWTYVMIHWRR